MTITRGFVDFQYLRYVDFRYVRYKVFNVHVFDERGNIEVIYNTILPNNVTDIYSLLHVFNKSELKYASLKGVENAVSYQTSNLYWVVNIVNSKIEGRTSLQLEEI